MKFKVLIQPNAKKNEVVGNYSDALKIKIKAPPIDSKANQELIRFLSEILKISKSQVSVCHGETSKNKLIQLDVEKSEEKHIKQKLGIA